MFIQLWAGTHIIVSFASDNVKLGSTGTGAALSLFPVNSGMAPEQQCDAPCTGQTYQSIDDSAQKGILSAKEPCHQIKLKNAHKPPVQTANDGKDQCQSVHIFTSVLTLDRDMFPKSERNIQQAQIAIAKCAAFRYNKQKMKKG